jgi:ABC-type transport system involved in cytochrome c biogenesis permease subunit
VWKGRRIALLSIIGFMSVIFTYVGVNFILAGLHSYGAT